MPGTEYLWRGKANCSPWGSGVQFTTPISAMSSDRSSTAGEPASELLQLFPNPANGGVVTIQTAGPGAQLSVMSMTGQAVVQQVMTDTTTLLPVNELENGVYIVHLQYANGDKAMKKLVVTR